MYSVRLWIEAVVVVATLLDWEKGSFVACFRYKKGMYVLLDLFLSGLILNGFVLHLATLTLPGDHRRFSLSWKHGGRSVGR